MPIGPKNVSLRKKLAGLSLLGLGVAASVPAIATALNGHDDASIITASADKVDTGEVINAELPPALTAEEIAAEEEIKPVRTILPEAEPVLIAPAREITADMQVEAAAEQVTPPQSAARMAVSGSTAQPDTMTGDTADTMAASAQPLAGSSAPAISGGMVTLALDHARVMRVMADIGTIIIGNPAIADVSMPDPSTMILTGKSFGETNLVMLDPEGEIIAEQTIQVTTRGQNTVSVFRGTQRTTFACSPTCEVRPTPGDDTEQLDAALAAFEARNAAALSAANGE